MRPASCILLVGVLLCVSCAHKEGTRLTDTGSKIQVDLRDLDADGLRGPPDGKVAVSYEFAIPNTEDCRAQVRAIDATVQFVAGSPGRIGAGSGECLCIGSTYQPDYAEVLRALVDLPFVDRIIECHFE